MSELKPCPFCKAELEQFNAVAVAHPSCGTGYCLLSGRVLVPSEFDRFNRRPIEDELRAKLKVAESDLALLSISLDHSNQGDPVIRLVNESVKKTLARIKE